MGKSDLRRARISGSSSSSFFLMVKLHEIPIRVFGGTGSCSQTEKMDFVIRSELQIWDIDTVREMGENKGFSVKIG